MLDYAIYKVYGVVYLILFLTNTVLRTINRIFCGLLSAKGGKACNFCRMMVWLRRC